MNVMNDIRTNAVKGWDKKELFAGDKEFTCIYGVGED